MATQGKNETRSLFNVKKRRKKKRREEKR